MEYLAGVTVGNVVSFCVIGHRANFGDLRDNAGKMSSRKSVFVSGDN